MFIIGIGVVLVSFLSIVTMNERVEANIEEDIKNEMNTISSYVSKEINNLIKIDKEDDIYEVLNEGSKLFNCYIYFDGVEDNYAGKYIDKDILEKYKERLKKDNSKTVLSIDKKEDIFAGTLLYPLNKETNEGFIVQKSYRDKYISYERLKKRVFFVQGSLALLLILIIYIIVKKNTRELESLAKNIRKFGNGEKVLEKKTKRKDEIGILISEFNEMEKNLVKIQKKEQDFFKCGTHELKTPLTAIKGYSELLLDESFEDEFIIEAIEGIYNESEKMKSLVEKFLILEKNREKVNLYKEEVDIPLEIENILKSIEKTILEKGLDIELNIEVKEIKIFKEDFRIVLSNLIGNAVNHTKGKNIKISVDGSVIGISNKIENKEIFKKDIFEPFIKDETNKDIIKSSGLGLYVCKEVCTRNKWNLNYSIEEDVIAFKLKF
ncbi:MAG: histidine kinase dimerization/phospho-acceptor domain-containing protein [Clostridium sp.]|uniref:sensor histidine kinase n=1 Tax=Clostridium sp. TaxID=1506 RepID=UPI003F2C957D